MLVLDDTIVNVALPSMQRSLHLATSHLNWVISFYALAFGGLMLAGGRAGDLFGRLKVFRLGIAVFTALIHLQVSVWRQCAALREITADA